MNPLRKLVPRLTYPNIVASAVVLFAVPWLYWAIMDRRPAADQVSEVISTEVLQGDFLQVRYRLTWTADCRIVAFRYIIDEMQVEWPISAQERIVQAGPAEFTIRIPVPMAAAPGEAVYKGTIRYECNPFQRFFPLEQQLRERHFTVVEDTDLAWRRRQGVYEGPPIMRRFAGIAG
jgi:hypothetical protein